MKTEEKIKIIGTNNSSYETIKSLINKSLPLDYALIDCDYEFNHNEEDIKIISLDKDNLENNSELNAFLSDCSYLIIASDQSGYQDVEIMNFILSRCNLLDVRPLIFLNENIEKHVDCFGAFNLCLVDKSNSYQVYSALNLVIDFLTRVGAINIQFEDFLTTLDRSKNCGFLNFNSKSLEKVSDFINRITLYSKESTALSKTLSTIVNISGTKLQMQDLELILNHISNLVNPESELLFGSTLLEGDDDILDVTLIISL